MRVQPFYAEHHTSDERSSGVEHIVTVREFMPEQTRSITLFSDRYVLTTRRNHPLARQPLSLDDFCGAEQLLVSPNRAVGFGVTDAALVRLGRSRRIRLVVPTFALAPKLLSETDLVAVLPERLVGDFPDTLATQTLPFTPDPFEVLAGWPERLQQAPMHQWLREALRIYVGER